MIMVLWWSGDGLCLLAKRLKRGRFVWPQADNGSVALTQAQLSMPLERHRLAPAEAHLAPHVGLVNVAQRA